MADAVAADIKHEEIPQDTAEVTSGVVGSKKCTLCSKPRNVLVRCQIDHTNKWHFVCPGKCWTNVSGGEIDARGQKDQFPYYVYGGMWKNRHADGPLNAKKPKKAKKKSNTQLPSSAVAAQEQSADTAQRE